MPKKILFATLVISMLISALYAPIMSLAYTQSFRVKRFGNYLLIVPNYLEIEDLFKLPSRGLAYRGIGGLSSLKVNYFDNVRYFLKYIEPKPTTSIADVLKYIGVSSAREEYGLTGEGVTVGIVDTGIDFSIPSLGLNKIARDPSGKPLLLDADMLGFVITDLSVEEKNGILQVKDKEFYVYFPLGYVGKIKLHRNWTAPEIKSVSGKYKFGLFVQVALQRNLWLDAELSVAYFAPVVLVDSKKPGVYDTVFVDLSTTWYTLKNFLYAIGYVNYPASSFLYDFSFKDEKPLSYGNELAYIDENGDGYPEFSLGAISGYVYDVFGLIGKNKPIYEIVEKRAWEPAGSGIYPGLDPKGRYVDFFYDPMGHGTSVASIIAGKKVYYQMFYYEGNVKHLEIVKTEGIAPEAKIAAATGLYVGSVVTAELWLSGYNYVYPWNWTYSGRPRVDIISNSWGLIEWNTLYTYGIRKFAPGKDPISKYEDKIVSTGVLVVHAAGNSGPGYGTVAIGGSSSKAVTVGAITIFKREVRTWDYGLLLPKGTEGEIVSWSSRGPSLEEAVKPNIVAPGAYALVPIPALGGLGDGKYAVDVFGGTSMSTPIVSGASALLIEKFRKEGKPWTPEKVKETLFISSKDLGYGPLSQGWGELNVTEALKFIEHGISINNTDPSLTLNNNYTITFEIKGLHVVKAYAEEMRDVDEVFLGEINVSENYSYLEVPLNRYADILEVYVNHSLKDLNEYLERGDYSIENVAVAVLGLWNDTNGNGEVDFGREFLLVNHDFSSSNVLRLTGNINNMKGYSGKVVVGVRNVVPRNMGKAYVYAKYYKWVETDKINVALIRGNLGTEDAIVKITCNPEKIGYGVYEAKVILESLNGIKVHIPVVVFVNNVVNNVEYTLKPANEEGIPKWNVMYEGLGWISGTSFGDWRTYRIKVNPKFEGVIVETSVLNAGEYVDIETLAFNSSGYFIGGIVSVQHPILGILGSSAPLYKGFGGKTLFALRNDGSEIILTTTPTLTQKPLAIESTIFVIDANIFYYRGDEGVLMIYSKYPLGIVEIVEEANGSTKRILVLNHRGGLVVKPVIVNSNAKYYLVLHEIPNIAYAGIAYKVHFTPIIKLAKIPFTMENYAKFYEYIKAINVPYSK